MAIMTFELPHGYKAGETTHLEVGLRELSSGDYIDAQLAAEKVVMQNGVAVAYTSDVMYGLELLMRQVEFIGSVQGPLSIKELRKLHADDFNLLQQKASELDQLLIKELEARGRS
ncbi:phage tail assembly protein [Vibrio algicola]|uniref:Mu-like prophage FluMu protein gp41 n=1 Tax=Vibrio algicola TaxID=2662262 RepID=A0A5Q0THT5_9VIBR|nr:phage tail assembly protein [Vibrio algicola]